MKVFNINEYLDRKYEIYKHYEFRIGVDRNRNKYVAYVDFDPYLYGLGTTPRGALTDLSDQIHLFWSLTIE